MYRFAVIVLAFFTFAYSQVVSAQVAAGAAAYELFMAKVTTFGATTVAYATNGAVLANGVRTFSAPTFSAGGAAVATAARVAVGAETAAIVVTGGASGAAVFNAVKLLAMGSTGAIGIGMTALTMYPMVVDYFSVPDKVRLGPLSARDSDKPFERNIPTSGVQFVCTYRGEVARGAGVNSCANAAVKKVNAWYNPPSNLVGRCARTVPNNYDGYGCTAYVGDTDGSAGSISVDTELMAVPGPWIPASMDDIAPYMDKPISPETFKALLDAGAKIEVTPRVINGPEYVPLPKTVETVETPEKITTTEKQKGVKLEYKTKIDPATGNPLPYVQATPKETTTVKEKDKATGVEKVVSTTTTETGDKPKTTEPQEIETCGLPGKPKCLIDETGTPEPVTDEKYKPRLDDYQTKQKDLKDTVSGVADKSFFTGWGAVFVTPPLAACVPYTLPRDMGTLDPCPVVDGMRSVMAYIWAITGLWLSMRMIRQVM